MDADEVQMAEMALVENIQRENLSAIEEAKSYVEIMKYAGINQSQLALRVGKSQSSIANKIRLLDVYKRQNHISVPLKISDIYYIEKDNKNLVYHTKRGEFSERKSIKDAEKYFEKYHFLRIHSSFLVNLQYVTRFETESVFLQDVYKRQTGCGSYGLLITRCLLYRDKLWEI